MDSSIVLDRNFSVSIPQDRPILSNEVHKQFVRVLNPVTLSLAILGVATNAINIRVFVEQGIKNGNTSIGLLALAVFDLMACVLIVPYFSCHLIIYLQDMPSYVICKTYTTLPVYLYSVINHCSNWTTVYISLERTLCVVFPLKVKLILKPKVAYIGITAIFAYIFTVQMIYSMSTSIDWRFNPNLNRTLPYIYEPPFATNYLYISTSILTTVMNPLSMAIVAINTAIILYKLRQIKRWRDTTTTSGGNQQAESTTRVKNKPISSKEVDTLKSVTTVTCIFLVCLSVSHVTSIAFFVQPGMTMAGINKNLMLLTYGIRFTFNMINSSTNFFFYLRVSSRYKETFNAVFPMCSRIKSNAISSP